MNLFPIFIFAILLGLSSATLIARCDGLVSNVTRMTTSIANHATYRLSITLGAVQKNVYTILGTPNHPLHVPAAYQAPFGGENIGNPSLVMTSAIPALQYDSWLTVGITDGASGLGSAGITWGEWTASAGISCNDCGIFFMNPNSATLTGNVGTVVLAQVTVSGGFTATLNVQGVYTNGGTWRCNDIMFTSPNPTCNDIDGNGAAFASCVADTNHLKNVLNNTCATDTCTVSDCCDDNAGYIFFGQNDGNGVNNGFYTCKQVKNAYNSATCGCS